MSHFANDDIRCTAERIAESKIFERSKRMISLLRYIVEQALAGDTDRLKGYSIGLDVFERPVDFDPERDTIVRVEMGRLRKKLELYYLTEGKDDPIVISIPVGTYVPVFQPRKITLTSDEDEKNNNQFPSKTSNVFARKVFSICFASFVIISIVAGWIFYQEHFTWQTNSDSQFADALILPNGPAIAVLKFRDITGDKNDQSFAEGITAQIVSKLSRFRSLFVIAPDTAFQFETLDQVGIKLDQKILAHYLLTGTIRRADHRMSINVQLVDASTKQVLWSKVFDEELRATTIFQLENKIARNVASKLGQPEGVINKQITRDLKTSNAVQLDNFRCVLKFHWYLRHKNLENHLAVRNCLRISLTSEKCYSDAWAAMSWIIADEQRLNFNPEKEQKSPFTRSLEAAEKAVECDPQNATAQHYLAKAQFTVGNDKQSTKSFSQALKLNPNDANLLANTGTSIALLGDWNQGVLLMNKAIALNPNHPRWYFGILFLNSFRKNESLKAVNFAQNYFRTNILLSHIYLVAALAQAGRDNEAKQSMEQMARAFPDYKKLLEQQLGIWRIPTDLSQLLKQNVAKVAISHGS